MCAGTPFYCKGSMELSTGMRGQSMDSKHRSTFCSGVLFVIACAIRDTRAAAIQAGLGRLADRG